MWNLEIDDGDYESEKQMKAAMDGVLASLVEVVKAPVYCLKQLLS